MFIPTVLLLAGSVVAAETVEVSEGVVLTETDLNELPLGPDLTIEILTGGAIAPVGMDFVTPFDFGASVLNVRSGGELISNEKGDFRDSFIGNVEVNIFEGGIAGEDLHAVSGAVLNMRGGRLLDSPSVKNGGTLNIYSGEVGDSARVTGTDSPALGTGVLNVFGGKVGRGLSVSGDSTMTVAGGVVASDARLGFNSEAILSGGAIGDGFAAQFGTSVTVSGGDYHLNGEPIAGLGAPGATLGIHVPDGFVLSGVFADGTPFAFASQAGDDLTDTDLTFESVALPPIGPAVITASTDPVPRGIREGQTLIIDDGGVVDDHFTAGPGSTVRLLPGGVMGIDLNLIGATFEMSGGRIGNGVDALHGTTALITGGVVTSSIRAGEGSEIEITGGVFDSGLQALPGSAVTIRGGAIDAGMRARSGADLVIVGGEFRLDDEPISGVGDVAIPEGSLLTGVLEDGRPFLFTSERSDSFANGSLSLEIIDVAPVSAPVVTLPGDPVPPGVRSGQTVIVQEGGEIGPYLNVDRGGTLRVEGGEVGDGLEVVSGLVEVSAGNLGERVNLFEDSILAVSGGAIEGFTARAGSAAHITGGEFGHGCTGEAGSTLHIAGGAFANNFSIRAGGAAFISGGNFGDVFSPSFGGVAEIRGGVFGDLFHAIGDASVRLIGNEFRIDGEPVYIVDAPEHAAHIDIPEGSLFSGVLADGTPFVFLNDGDVFNGEGDQIESGVLMLEAAQLPEIGPAVIRASMDPVPLGIRAGQTIIVDADGRVADNFAAGPESVVMIEEHGGVGGNLEAHGATVLMSGGRLGPAADFFDGSTFEMTGGAVRHGFQVYAGAVARISGGTATGGDPDVNDGAVLYVSGGFIESGVTVNTGGTLHWTGGVSGRGPSAHTGAVVNISGGNPGSPSILREQSTLNLFVTSLSIDGQSVPLTPGEAHIIAQRGGATLEATLRDGETFQLALDDESGGQGDFVASDATLSVTLAPPFDCPTDLNADGLVDAADLAVMIGDWGGIEGLSFTDLSGDSVVGSADLALMLGSWGVCP